MNQRRIRQAREDNLAAAAAALAAALAVISTLNAVNYMASQWEYEHETQRGPYQYRPPVPYIQFKFQLDKLPDELIMLKFRFTKEEIHQIIPYLQLHQIEWQNHNRPSNELAFCILLGRLAYPARYDNMTNLFGRSKSYINMVFTDVVLHIQDHFQDMLHWDPQHLTVEQLHSYTRHINNLGGGDQVWGYINGTLQRTARPGENQHAIYSGHKHYHSFKFQAVITPDGLLSSIFSPVVGSHGDWFVFQQSLLENNIKKLFKEANVLEEERLYIYGDPVYTGSAVTIGAYKKPRGCQLTAAQQEFNKNMSENQVSIEHGFGLVQQYWAKNSYHLSQQMGLSPVAASYLAACLLTNILTCLHGNQVAERFAYPPPTLDEYFAGRVRMDEAGGVENV
ncbi:hypothetical protein AJ80_10062 [Polytolypa hystricis UAMH7299]|uniref:DDE Tnp4 domain-containing protein n=1 Tax=Polytolypa hystricis (strain UAMH7299) TaxID=1447883 RepID=A0A2B7W650_POLH7|nr:hypothetical protein AJ80_10062 [Polytolypa hystricis UAMH7299]